MLLGCWQLLSWFWRLCTHCTSAEDVEEVQEVQEVPEAAEAEAQEPLLPASRGAAAIVVLQEGLLEALDLPGALPVRRRGAAREETPRPAVRLAEGDSSTALSSSAVRPGQLTTYVCHCNLRLRALIVRRDTPNKGRLFVTCPKSLADPTRCSYFRWI